MMLWYGDGMNGWGWFTMAAGTVLFWALLITAVVLVFRALDRTAGPGEHTERSGRAEGARPATPERILGERLARGDIDEDEYRRRLSVLRSAEP
ncbi:SHOCT domain-containing protein [Streptomyces zhihengii]